MSVFESAMVRTTARANATVRLCAAREELWRAEGRHAGARGTPVEASALQRVGEATAELATREQWSHWIEHGTTIRPAADGEWGWAPEAEDAVETRWVEPGGLQRARAAVVAGRGDPPRRLWSVT
jgi:hypothetical protein